VFERSGIRALIRRRFGWSGRHGLLSSTADHPPETPCASPAPVIDPAPAISVVMPSKKKPAAAPANAGDPIASIKYPAKRKNIPPAGIEAQGRVQEEPRVRYEYNPHLPPALRSAPAAGETDQLLDLLRNALLRTTGQPQDHQLIETATQRPLTAEEAARLRTIFEAAVTPEAASLLADALRRHEPWLEWSGKREKPWFEVEPVALHMHERVSTRAILRVLARQDVQRDLFADPQHDYAKAVQFYQHDVDWANRMILGDSLQVMASLARREDLAGKVQMIYLDPPYGIKFASNFQPQLGQRDVKDREQDLTREPEMVKAYRDTWTLGIHSYLAYLRDRLAMAKELLTDSGSIFVQISDENLHRVRCVMDEVFGAGNCVATILMRKSGWAATTLLPQVHDFILWYARDKPSIKYRDLLVEKSLSGLLEVQGAMVENPKTGEMRSVTSGERDESADLPQGWVLFQHDNLTSTGPSANSSGLISFQGAEFWPGSGGRTDRHWKTIPEGIYRLGKCNRLLALGSSLRQKRYATDYPVTPLGDHWNDTAVSGFADQKVYVVQTNTLAIQRCLLMTTDPGDLVLDPTCGSGTTAYVAEQWGRRWITCDTSRVALALAKHRLMTAKFDYYRLRGLNAEDVARNPEGTWLSGKDEGGRMKDEGKMTFQCKTVPHITLKSIARNTSLDPIFAKHEPILTEKLAALNAALSSHAKARSREGDELRERLVGKMKGKCRGEKASALTEADKRRWILPGTSALLFQAIKGVFTAKQAADLRAFASSRENDWQEWEVPFDTDPDWPQPLQDALTAYRSAWRAKMDEVNECIAANATMEELVDKPDPVGGIVRVSGPFTIEGVIAVEDGPESPIGGAPDELDAFDGDAEVQNAEAHLDKILRLLKASGVDFPGNKNMKFARLDALTSASLVHAEGEWLNGDQVERRVAVSVGPEVGNVTAMQVEDVIRDANRKGYDDVVFAGFGFDAAAQDAIEGASHPKLRLHMALIRPDVAMGDLLKTQPGSQLFTVFSAPRVKGPAKQKDGEYLVEVEGMDVYDPVSNTLFPTDKDRIAAWFLDTDYDGRTFCICQAFFPDKGKWAKLAKALGKAGVIEEDAFDALSGLTSLPFPRPDRLGKGEPWRVAVKVIDPRGNEGLRVLTVND
jgi:adenine-specific DNA-methyltransferase